MFWLTERILPAALRLVAQLRSPRRAISASGFCARIALMCGCFSAWRIRAGCWSGGKARSRISTCGILDQRFRRVVDGRDAPALGDLLGAWPACARRSPRPESRPPYRRRDGTSAMIMPAPMQPIRYSLVRTLTSGSKPMLAIRSSRSLLYNARLAYQPRSAPSIPIRITDGDRRRRKSIPDVAAISLAEPCYFRLPGFVSGRLSLLPRDQHRAFRRPAQHDVLALRQSLGAAVLHQTFMRLPSRSTK